MTSTPISALAAAKAFDGTEVLPLVQGGGTRRGRLSDMIAQGGAAQFGALNQGVSTAQTTASLSHLKLDHAFDIRSYGATCDGSTDDGPAIQLAVNAAIQVGGGTVLFPSALILVNTQVTLYNAAVRLQGCGWSEDCASGTRILTTALVTTFRVQGMPAKGSSIKGMSFQQAHPAQGPGWAPTVYPPTIWLADLGGEVMVDDLFCLNCYDFVRSTNSGRTAFGRLRGQPLHCGLSIDGSYDTTHGDHLHFWPYWTTNYHNADGTRSPGSYVLDWMQANGDAVRLFRTDGFQVGSIFAFGYYSGLRLSYSTAFIAGTATIPQIGALYPDSCKFGVLIDGTGASAHIGSLYTGGENLDNLPITGSFAIYFQSTFCSVSIASARLFFCDSYALVMDQAGGANTLMIGNLEVILPDQGLPNNPSVLFSANTVVPNRICIANPVQVSGARGQYVINDCNALVSIPCMTPLIVHPASGDTIYVVPSRDTMLIEPAGTLAALTVVLPANYIFDGEITVVTTQDITSVTWSAGGTVIVAPPANLAGGVSRRFRYASASITVEGTNAWFTF